MMMPSRSAIVTVPVWTTGWPAKSLWAGTSVQVPFRALCSRAKAENAKRRGVKTAPVIEVVEYVLMISFRSKIALGGHQRPGAVQGAVFAREGGEREEEGRQDGSGN